MLNSSVCLSCTIWIIQCQNQLISFSRKFVLSAMHWVPCNISCPEDFYCVRPSYLLEPEICVPSVLDMNRLDVIWSPLRQQIMIIFLLVLLGLLVIERAIYVLFLLHLNSQFIFVQFLVASDVFSNSWFCSRTG